ncbi:MAG: CAP domain-containing protein [Planctomycetota bacterium]
MARLGRRLLTARRGRRISSGARRRTVASPFTKPIITVSVALGATLVVVFIAANAGPTKGSLPDIGVPWNRPWSETPAPPKPPSVEPVKPPPVEPVKPPPVELVKPPPVELVKPPPVEPVKPPSEPRGLSAADVAKLIKQLDSNDKALRQAAFEKLRSCGAQEECAAYLLEKRRAILALLNSEGLGRAIAKLQHLALDLHEKRRAALAFISDGRKFTKRRGYGQVSKLVARVESAYEVKYCIPRFSRSMARRVDRLFEYDEYLARLGRSQQADYAPYQKTLLLLNKAPLSVPNFPVSGGEFQLDAYNEKVMEINKRIRFHLSREERKAIRLTNTYRMIMGMRALLIDASLVEAARQHSQEMKSLGYFSHTSPTAKFRTPWARAELFGYQGGACMGENIALGARSGAAAYACWLRSPPHHRSMLNPNYFDIGMGHVAGHWTEMFGGSKNTAKRSGLLY